MRIILIRHGTRARGPGISDDNAPLTEQGRGEAICLELALTGLGVNPEAYLTSAKAHARQTAEILAGQGAGTPAPPVVSLEALTQIRPPGNIEEIDAEARRLGVQMDTLGEVVIVGHEPYLSQLTARLTGARSRPFARAELVCTVADSFRDFLQGEGQIAFRYPVADYQEEQLRPKIQSKLTVSTFLAGFTSTILFSLLSSETSLSQLQAFAVVLMTISLGLFIAAVYCFDSLSMPEGFWAYDDRGKALRFSKNFEETRHYHGELYAHMIWIWSWVFTPAVGCGLAGFVALLINMGNASLAIAGLTAIAITIGYYQLIRPRLGVD